MRHLLRPMPLTCTIIIAPHMLNSCSANDGGTTNNKSGDPTQNGSPAPNSANGNPTIPSSRANQVSSGTIPAGQTATLLTAPERQELGVPSMFDSRSNIVDGKFGMLSHAISSATHTISPQFWSVNEFAISSIRNYTYEGKISDWTIKDPAPMTQKPFEHLRKLGSNYVQWQGYGGNGASTSIGEKIDILGKKQRPSRPLTRHQIGPCTRSSA